MEHPESPVSDADASPIASGPPHGRKGTERRGKAATALVVASLILGLAGLAALLVLEPIFALPLPILGLACGLFGLSSGMRKVAIFAVTVCGVVLALGIAGAVVGRIGGSTGPACPPPGLQSASAYVPGVADIPDGQYLFVEWWRDQVQSSLGGCQLYFDEPTYSGGNEGLMGWISRGAGSDPVRGFWGAGYSSRGRKCGAFSELTPIRSFPFVAPAAAGFSEGDIVIHSVDASGAIVAEVKGCTVWIEPGQRWSHEEHASGLQGPETTFYRLTNYGLLDESQIDLEGFDPGATER